MRAWIVLSCFALLAGCAGCEGDSPRATTQEEETAEGEPVDDTLRITVDARAEGRPISPYVYGINGLADLEALGPYTKLIRFGGNRTSNYNWRVNASNSGADPPGHQNDAYLSAREEPGGAVLDVLDAAQARGAAALITVPMLGHVAADRDADGDVAQTPDYLETRFRRSVARSQRGACEAGAVCQDEYVRFVREAAEERGVTVFFALDNEPSSWTVTHPRLRSEALTYAELIDTSREYAAMIRDEAPGAKIFGPVSFGWPAMTRLTGASDARGRHFIRTYLRSLRGRVDVLDVHWYPDVRADGVSVTEDTEDDAVARLRMQVPRSLHDPTYLEPSWIVEDDLRGSVKLLDRLQTWIDGSAPGAEIAITEWAYGGAAHPSGAVAVADALGAMATRGVLAACYWPLTNQAHDHAFAALRLYADFGPEAIDAASSDLSQVGVWASRDGEALVLVIIGRADEALDVELRVEGMDAARILRRVIDGAPEARDAPALTMGGGRVTVPVPARSVSLLRLEPA